VKAFGLSFSQAFEERARFVAHWCVSAAQQRPKSCSLSYREKNDSGFKTEGVTPSAIFAQVDFKLLSLASFSRY